MTADANADDAVTPLVLVIPTLNEEAALPVTLAAIAERLDREHPIVVADCGSWDRTTAIARRHGCYVVSGPTLTGRGTALRAGADFALDTFPDAGVIWLLHADTLPPRTGDAALLQHLSDNPGTAGGAFQQRFDTEGLTPAQRRGLRFVSFCNRMRYRVSGTYFGDQGLFVRADVLRAIGGVPENALFEDIELCRAIKKHGRLDLLPARIVTSPRRFVDNGILKQVADDWRPLRKHRRGRLSTQDTDAYNQVNRGTSL